jgi:hypothetical protein
MNMKISENRDGSIDLNIDREQLGIIIGCIGYLCYGKRSVGFHTLIGTSPDKAEALVDALVRVRDAIDAKRTD